MTLRHNVAVAATSHVGQPRLAYRNRATDLWTMVTPDPVSVALGDGTDLQQTDFHSGLDAMRALLFDTTYFDPEEPLDVDAADELLRARTVEVYQVPVETADDGTIIGVRKLLDHVAAEPGQPMRPERAVNELATAPEPIDDSLTFSAPTADAGSPPLTAAATVDTAFASIDVGGGRTYRPRTLFGRPDVEFLRQLRAMNGHIRLSGSPGAGKTSVITAAFDADVISVQGHPDLTVAALCGQYLPHEGSWRWVDGPLTRAMVEGKVLLVDEINRAPKDIDDALLSPTDHRRQLVLSDRPDLPPITAAPGFMVAVTLNDDDTGTRPLSSALRRRLTMHVRVDTDYAIAAERGITDRLLRVARNLRTSAIEFGRVHDCDPSWYPQMADLENAQAMLAFGEQAAFTALTASVDDRVRLTEAAEAFSSVFGEPVRVVAELGT